MNFLKSLGLVAFGVAGLSGVGQAGMVVDNVTCKVSVGKAESAETKHYISAIAEAPLHLLRIPNVNNPIPSPTEHMNPYYTFTSSMVDLSALSVDLKMQGVLFLRVNQAVLRDRSQKPIRGFQQICAVIGLSTPDGAVNQGCSAASDPSNPAEGWTEVPLSPVGNPMLDLGSQASGQYRIGKYFGNYKCQFRGTMEGTLKNPSDTDSKPW